MPTFALLYAPAQLTLHLRRLQNAPLPLITEPEASVNILVPIIIGAVPLDQ